MKEFDYMEVVMQLQNKNVTGLIVSYSGGGDSGCIDSVHFSYKEHENLEELIDHYQDGNTDDVSLKDYPNLENYIYKFLDDIEDWWNNDGGYGTMYILLKDQSYKIENNVYYTSVKEYTHTGKFNSKIQ